MNQIVVYAPGVWDLLHVGHLRFLEAAKSLGDKLIVGVPTDKVVIEDKHRAPVIPQDQRLEMIRGLRCVDYALLYDELLFNGHLMLFHPHILAVGEQWGKERRHRAAEAMMAQHGGRIAVIPYTQGVCTTQLREKIVTTDRDG